VAAPPSGWGGRADYLEDLVPERKESAAPGAVIGGKGVSYNPRLSQVAMFH
jgi:hypothetical protein